MYGSVSTSTEKCLAYSITDHLNCVTLDCWPSQSRLAELLGLRSVKTVQRAARGLEAQGYLTIKRAGRNSYRYAPVFLPGDEDKFVPASGQPRPSHPDRNVSESSLPIHSKSSDPTKTAVRESASERHALPYNRKMRGAIELQIADRLGPGGMDILARLYAIDEGIVDRLCRAQADGRLGDRELVAARLAAEQT